MNSKQQKTYEAIFSNPINGNIEWARIESLLKSLGCNVFEGPGSSVTFEYNGMRASFHRPHPGKESLRYRISAVREFIERAGFKP